MRQTLMAAALLLSGCPGFGDETLAEQQGIDEVPTYEADIKPLLEKHCLTCHGEVLRAGAPVNLHTYEDATDLAQRILVRAVQQVSMPPGGGIDDATERALLEAWINGGTPRGEVLPDGAVEPDAAPDVGPDMGVPTDDAGPDSGDPAPTWNDDIQPIVNNNCAFPGCHGGDSPQANLNLESWAGFFAGGISGDLTGAGDPAESLLIDRLRARDGFPIMPDGSPTGLPEEEIQLFEAWIAAGIPEGT